MKRCLVGERTVKDCAAILLPGEGQTIEPFCPLVLEMPLDTNLIDFRPCLVKTVSSTTPALRMQAVWRKFTVYIYTYIVHTGGVHVDRKDVYKCAGAVGSLAHEVMCAPLAYGVACALCPDGYSFNGKSCEQCRPAGPPHLALFVFIVLYSPSYSRS